MNNFFIVHEMNSDNHAYSGFSLWNSLSTILTMGKHNVCSTGQLFDSLLAAAKSPSILHLNSI